MASLAFLFVPEGRRSLLGPEARGGGSPNGASSPPCLSTPLIVGAEVILCKNHHRGHLGGGLGVSRAAEVREVDGYVDRPVTRRFGLLLLPSRLFVTRWPEGAVV